MAPYRGFESRVKASCLIKNRSAWATGDDNCSVQSAVNEYLTIDRGGKLYLDYAWHLEALTHPGSCM